MSRATPSAIPPTFDDALASIVPAANGLRDALRAALDRVLPESTGARACGRALGVSAHTGWRCWTIARASDTATLVRALPGSHGWTLILSSLSRRGCADALVEALREAIDRLLRTISECRVDATMLRSLAAGGLDSHRERETLDRARRSARKANEVSFGLRAEAIGAAFMFGRPNRRGLIDATTLLLYHGLSRRRPGPDWPIYRGSVYYAPEGSRRGIDATRHRRLRSLERDCSTADLALGELVERIDRGSNSLTIDLGTIAAHRRPASLDAAFIDHVRRAGSVGPSDERGEARTSILVPTPRIVFEVLMHRDLPREGEVAAAMYGIPEGFGVEPTLLDAGRLPLAVQADQVDLPRLPASLRRIEPAWQRMIGRGAERLRSPLDHFDRFRLVVEDPPLHAVLVMRWAMRKAAAPA